MDPLGRVVEVTGPLTPKMAARVRASLRSSAIATGIICGFTWLLVVVIYLRAGLLPILLGTLGCLVLGGFVWSLISWSMLLDLRNGQYRIVAGVPRTTFGYLHLGDVQLGRVYAWQTPKQRGKAPAYTGMAMVTSWSRQTIFATYDDQGQRTDRFAPYKPDEAERAMLDAAVAAALAAARTPPQPVTTAV